MSSVTPAMPHCCHRGVTLVAQLHRRTACSMLTEGISTVHVHVNELLLDPVPAQGRLAMHYHEMKCRPKTC